VQRVLFATLRQLGSSPPRHTTLQQHLESKASHDQSCKRKKSSHSNIVILEANQTLLETKMGANDSADCRVCLSLLDGLTVPCDKCKRQIHVKCSESLKGLVKLYCKFCIKFLITLPVATVEVGSGTEIRLGPSYSLNASDDKPVNSVEKSNYKAGDSVIDKEPAENSVPESDNSLCMEKTIQDDIVPEDVEEDDDYGTTICNQCSLCKVVLSSSLSRHVHEVNCFKYRPFCLPGLICKICGYRASNQKGLFVHLGRIHKAKISERVANSNAEPFAVVVSGPFDNCNDNKNTNALKRRCQNQSNKLPKPVRVKSICSVCQEMTYFRHQVRCKKLEKYICPGRSCAVCHQVFKSMKGLLIHIHVHISCGNTDNAVPILTTNYKCPKCGHTKDTLQKVQTHMIFEHGKLFIF
jgi:hypothetical protein